MNKKHNFIIRKKKIQKSFLNKDNFIRYLKFFRI